MATITRILLDGDMLPYQMGFATETSTYETEDGEVHATLGKAKAHVKAAGTAMDIFKRTEAEPVSHALRLTKNMLLGVKKKFADADIEVFLTGSTNDGYAANFRIDVAKIKPYKGNRIQPKPLHYEAIRKYLRDKWGAVTTDGYEADDALGINQDDSSCIATIDKDLNMIPGFHYNWQKDQFFDVNGADASFFFYKQLLTGDSTDNIVGLPGVGPVKAEKILAGHTSNEDMYWRCVCAYENSSYDKPMDALLENARLLWIQQELGQVWQPPE